MVARFQLVGWLAWSGQETFVFGDDSSAAAEKRNALCNCRISFVPAKASAQIDGIANTARVCFVSARERARDAFVPRGELQSDTAETLARPSELIVPLNYFEINCFSFAATVCVRYTSPSRGDFAGKIISASCF